MGSQPSSRRSWIAAWFSGETIFLRCDIDRKTAGLNDDIARPHTVQSVINAAPRAEIYECAVRAGHMGLATGSAYKTSQSGGVEGDALEGIG